MTKQLTPAQIKELRVFLADYGLEVKAKPKKASKEPYQPWPIGPRVPGKPKIKSRTYGHFIGSSTAARISATEFAEIKKRSDNMFPQHVNKGIYE
jgi:hypothetical protein